MRTLSDRERRLVAVLILIAVLTLVWAVLVWPYLAGFSARAEQRELLLREYQTNQRLIGSVGRLTRQAEKQRTVLRDYALFARTPAEAAAALELRLQEGIEQAGGELRSTEQVTVDAAGTVRARASARMPYPALVQFLTALENRPPFAAVERLAVAADQAVISGRLEPVDVSLEISAPYLRSATR